MSVNWWIAAVVSVAIGTVMAPSLTASGMRQLIQITHNPRRSVVLDAAAGAVGAAVAVVAARHAGSMWWLPALLVWTLTLVATADCDARIRRVPTRLLVRGGAPVLPLLVVAAVVTGDWRALVITAAAVLASGAVVGLCWRIAGVGFGDVRLAAAGGLGLGHATAVSIALGVALFAVLCVVQAICTYWRTRDRKAHFALTPALVLGFLTAAAA